ncbi:hypothetical protein [Kribbella solani]|uniref:hypothetical protein n=1 Tax=Kribbella solani TaxID=236067 RepID=UPI0029ACC3BF|nr:hypothetical protein [Kribbella solani]MDX2970910.1 hypothetical protein [Kribbella solani]
MDDTREVSAELHRLADGEPLEPFDTAQLVAKGRRGRRRRKLFGAGGAVAGVAVIALGATLVPNLTSADRQPSVAGQDSSMFGPVPGVPSGEDGVNQTISKAEAERRCALRNPEQKLPLMGKTFRSVHSAVYDFRNGTKPESCDIPGGDKPTAALIAEVQKRKIPADLAGQLKACSVAAWSDLTKWTVVAQDRNAALGKAVLVAVSPSREKAVSCILQTGESGPWYNLTSISSLTLDKIDPNLDPAMPAVGNKRLDLYSGGGGGGQCTNGTCFGDTYVDWGRAASNATKVKVQQGTGPVQEVPVNDGWFAYVFTSKAKHPAKVFPKATAYDKNNKVVRVFGEN